LLFRNSECFYYSYDFNTEECMIYNGDLVTCKEVIRPPRPDLDTCLEGLETTPAGVTTVKGNTLKPLFTL
jgi:hypothetical protein